MPAKTRRLTLSGQEDLQRQVFFTTDNALKQTDSLRLPFAFILESPDAIITGLLINAIKRNSLIYLELNSQCDVIRWFR